MISEEGEEGDALTQQNAGFLEPPAKWRRRLISSSEPGAASLRRQG